MKWNRIESNRIAATLILFSSLSAIAHEKTTKNKALLPDWEYLTSYGEKATYILKDSPKYIGWDIVAAWYLWDDKLQQIGQADRKFMSMKQLSILMSITYDSTSRRCYVRRKNGKWRTSRDGYFQDQAWVKIAPQSAHEVIFKYLCINK